MRALQRAVNNDESSQVSVPEYAFINSNEDSPHGMAQAKLAGSTAASTHAYL